MTKTKKSIVFCHGIWADGSCFSKRMGATVREVDASHVPMLSNPKVVIDVIRAAANA